MTHRAYLPIACGLVDELQLRSMRRTRVPVRWRVGESTREAHAVLTDVRTRDGAEFVVLDSGDEVRLDDLVEVDGIVFGAGC